MTARLTVFACVLLITIAGRAADPLAWDRLPPLPDPIGFAGSFAGTSGDTLIVAGGANFPDRPPWEGGTKAWTDRVFLLDRPEGPWREPEARLSRPLGYGVSITTDDGLLCLGGSHADGHTAQCFLLRVGGGRLEQTELPSLPRPCANTCGALIGNVVYVAGGLESPAATEAMNTFWSLDLSHPPEERRWTELAPCPGPPRMLAVAAAHGGSFYFFSGASLAPGPDGTARRTYLTDAYRFRPGSGNRVAGWTRIADLPRPAVAAPSPAIPSGGEHLLVLGGDDGTQVGFPPADHRGFPADVLAYHPITDTWTQAGTTPAPFVTTPLVPWHGRSVVPGGEVRPGVRSPQVWAASPDRSRTDFGTLDLAALAAYPALMLGIGLSCARRKKDADDYFRGGQRIPWWAAGLSIYAAMLSSITFMAIPAKSYATDWGFFLNYASLFLLAPLVTAVYLPFFRRLDVTSAYEYLERRFNLAARLFASVSFMVFQVGRTGIVLFLPALALSTVSDLDITTCVVGMGLLTILLTVFGGMEAVIWTDVAQSILLLAAALVSLVVLLLRLDGGPADFFAAGAANGKFFSDLSWSADLSVATGWTIFLGQLFTNFISYTSNQEVVQRYLTTPDERSAARAVWTNALVSIPSGLLFFAIGTALFVFYRQHPERLDPALARTDAIFPFFMVRELPAGVAGLVVAGIFAAAQPTSGLNSVAAAFTTDVYGRFRPTAGDRARLRVGRLVTAVTGVLGTLVALTMVRYPVESLWELFLNLLGLTGGAVAGLFALGLFTRRANGPGALLGATSAGLLLWLASRASAVYPLMYGAVAVTATFALGYLFSLLLPVTPKRVEGPTIDAANPGPSSAEAT